MKRYQAAIFDLDGTLLNTLGDLCGAVNAGLAARGYPPIDEEQTRQRVGNGIRNLILRSLPEGTDDGTADACLAGFRAHYEAHLQDRTRPYPGIPELLRALRAQGVKTAVLSNKYDPASKRLIASFFPGLVDLTFGEREGVPRKPDPTSAKEVLETLGVPAAETLYIGDSGVDMQTAKNAGLTAAARSCWKTARTSLSTTRRSCWPISYSRKRWERLSPDAGSGFRTLKRRRTRWPI